MVVSGRMNEVKPPVIEKICPSDNGNDKWGCTFIKFWITLQLENILIMNSPIENRLPKGEYARLITDIRQILISARNTAYQIATHCVAN